MGYKLASFHTLRSYHGQMNLNFYPKDMPQEEQMARMRANKQKIATELGLPGYGRIFIFSPFQYKKDGTKRYETGYCYQLTAGDIARYDDLYDLTVYADSIKVNPNDEGVKNVAVGFNVADCMVSQIINMETGEFNVSHWGGLDIDRGIIPPTMEEMLKGTDRKNLQFYSSPFAHVMNYDNSDDLKWATDDGIWGPYKQSYGDNGVSVNVEKAVFNQLLKYIPENNIHFSPLATNVVGGNFYSNALTEEHPEHAGRFLAGISVSEHIVPCGKEYIKVIER